MVPVCSGVMLELVLAVHSYHVIAYPEKLDDQTIFAGRTTQILRIFVVRSRSIYFAHDGQRALQALLTMYHGTPHNGIDKKRKEIRKLLPLGENVQPIIFARVFFFFFFFILDFRGEEKQIPTKMNR